MLKYAGGWSAEFAAHAGRHTDVRVRAVAGLTAAERAVLGRSLATFQVGESGTGEHLLAAAHGAGRPQDYIEALGAFVVEEQEHARLLALVLASIDVPLRTGHWSDVVFVFVRRVSSLRTEVLTLLVAEVIALRYYSALRDGIDVAEVSNVFGRIHADEVRHVDFHAATLPARLGRWPGPVRWTVRLLWNTLVSGKSVLVALDHRGALRLAGVGTRRFVADVWGLRRDLDRRLFR